MSPMTPHVLFRVSNTMMGVLPQPSRIPTICLVRIKKKAIAGGMIDAKLHSEDTQDSYMSEFSVKQGLDHKRNGYKHARGYRRDAEWVENNF